MDNGAEESLKWFGTMWQASGNATVNWENARRSENVEDVRTYPQEVADGVEVLPQWDSPEGQKLVDDWYKFIDNAPDPKRFDGVDWAASLRNINQQQAKKNK